MKKILSIILAILMIVTMIPFTPVAFAADDVHTHALMADGESIEFTEFPVDTRIINTAGNYYLTQDIELNDYLYINVEGTVNLCLNGHSITAVEKNSNQTAVFLYRGTLNLCDCQGGGCITSTEDSKASGLRSVSPGEINMYSGEIKDNYYYAVEGGNFNMYGGKLSGNKRAAVYVIDTFNMYGGEISDNSNEYGAVYVAGGDFTMYDGEIKNNINTSTIWNRGTVFVNSGAFTMKGGKITGNTGGSACGGVCSYENFVMEGGEISDNSGELGGVAVVRNNFIMNGGKISGNTADYGGGVWLNENASFIMNGGEISGNSAGQGGGVYSTYDSAKIILKKGVITGNTATYGGGVGAQYFNTPVEISGADVQIMGNTPNMSRGSITVSAPLDSEKTKIYVDVFDGEIIARPDGTNLTTLKGMEGCFIPSDEDILVICNEDGELEAVFWNSSIEEINGDLVVKTTVNDNVTYQWYEVNGEELTKLDGETSAKITRDKLVIGKTYACRIYLAGGEIETLTIKYTYVITHQPTAEEPYVELNDDTDATYQWYTLESGVEEITDQNASGDWQSMGAPFGNSVYEDGKWVADTFNNLQYYFMIELEAGQTINIEFASEVQDIIFSIFDTSSPPDFTEINDSEYSITVEESGVYWLVVYGTPVDYARATLEGFKYIPIEGETSAGLQNLTFGNNYACKATCGDGKTVLTSDFFEYAYLITHQPTAAEPYVELNDDTDATYQWYTIEGDAEKLSELTDENTLAYSYDGATATYDKEDGWSATYDQDGYYSSATISLKAGDSITVEFEGEGFGFVDVWDFERETSGGSYAEADEENPLKYVITVSEDGNYTVYTENPVNHKIYTKGLKEYIEIEGETSAKLQNPTFGNIYACKVTCGDGETVLTSDAFEYSYAITHQPTAEEPYVELNDDTDATYQWYTVEDDGEEITDKNASGDWQSLGAPFGNTVYEDGKWIAETYEGWQYYFMVDLEAGDTVNFEFASDVEAIVFEIDGKLTGGITEVGASEYSITVEESGNYWLIVLGTSVDYVRATVGSIEYTPIEGATSAEFNPTAPGKYACQVTFRDGTSEMSDAFELTHVCDFSGEWKYNSEKHWKECKCGLTGEEAVHSFTDSKCDCGYECTHETYTDGVCDNCGIVCAHNYGEGVLTRPERVTSTEWVDGYYTYTCDICGDSYNETVKRADYTQLDKVLDDYCAIINDSTVLDSVKSELDSIYDDNRDVIFGNRIESEQDQVDVVAKLLADKIDEITAGIEDGSAVKVNGHDIFNEYAEEISDELTGKYGQEELNEFIESLPDEVIDSLEDRTTAIHDEMAALTGSVKDNEEKLAELKAELDAIFDELENCFTGTHNGLKFEVTEEAECGKNAVESAVCTFCGETVTREVENSALTHSFTKYETVEEAKCGVAGKEVASCNHGCGTTDEKEIPALKHIFIDYIYNEDATCTADGTKTAVCTNGCGATDTVKAKNTKLDHIDEDGDKICDDCEAEIKDVCPDCGRPVHEGQINEYICMLITLIKLVVSLVKAVYAVV